MIGEVDYDLVLKLVQDKYPIEFNALQILLKHSLRRRLTTLERKYIHDAITAEARREATHIREGEKFGQITNEEILVVTAYSTDYTLGRVCEVINKEYATRHGYHFKVICDSYENMLAAIHPRTHCTWYKVLFLLQLLQKHSSATYKYIMWIDADAVIINHEQSIQELLALGQYRDLIVAEDMTQGCLINAGVMLIRNSAFSLQLWHQVWHSDEVKKFHDVYFYEQSAVIKLLRSRGNNLAMFKPFHSYCGGQLLKILPHIAVLPHYSMNTNHGYRGIIDNSNGIIEKDQGCISYAHSASVLPQFIFHAVGRWNKLKVLLDVIYFFKLTYLLPQSLLESLNMEFRLRRGKCGGIF